MGIDRDIAFTHRGWFGLCPIYIANPYSEEPFIDPRHWVSAPLLPLSESIYRLLFVLMEIVAPDAEPLWPISISGVLREPVVRNGRGGDADA